MLFRSFLISLLLLFFIIIYLFIFIPIYFHNNFIILMQNIILTSTEMIMGYNKIKCNANIWRIKNELLVGSLFGCRC